MLRFGAQMTDMQAAQSRRDLADAGDTIGLREPSTSTRLRRLPAAERGPDTRMRLRTEQPLRWRLIAERTGFDREPSDDPEGYGTELELRARTRGERLVVDTAGDYGALRVVDDERPICRHCPCRSAIGPPAVLNQRRELRAARRTRRAIGGMRANLAVTDAGTSREPRRIVTAATAGAVSCETRAVRRYDESDSDGSPCDARGPMSETRRESGGSAARSRREPNVDSTVRGSLKQTSAQELVAQAYGQTPGGDTIAVVRRAEYVEAIARSCKSRPGLPELLRARTCTNFIKATQCWRTMPP